MIDARRVLTELRGLNPSTDRPDELRRALESLLFRFCLGSPGLGQVRHALASLFDENKAAHEASNDTQPDSPDAFFLRHLVELRAFLAGRGCAPEAFITDRVARSVPSTYDFLAAGVDDWSAAKIANFGVLQAIQPSHRAAIVTTIRDEGLSMLEWVAHHRSIGFDGIFVYTNGNTDSSLPLLRLLDDNGCIYLLENEIEPDVPVQKKVYEHSLHFLPALRNYEWVFYLDADEFFIPRCEPGLNLDAYFQAFARAYPDESPSSVLFNWKWFGSENAFARTDGFVLDRFQHSIHNRHVKFFARTKDLLSATKVHVPTLFAGCWQANSAFQKVAPTGVEIDPVYSSGQINHYWNKSFEEFAIKKLRGRPSVSQFGQQISFASFFEWGDNGRRGNFDPPPNDVRKRTQACYNQLISLTGVKECLESIEAAFQEKLSKISADLNLEHLHKRRGRLEAA